MGFTLKEKASELEVEIKTVDGFKSLIKRNIFKLFKNLDCGLSTSDNIEFTYRSDVLRIEVCLKNKMLQKLPTEIPETLYKMACNEARRLST